jgi:hypothetical protein
MGNTTLFLSFVISAFTSSYGCRRRLDAGKLRKGAGRVKIDYRKEKIKFAASKSEAATYGYGECLLGRNRFCVSAAH